MTGRNVDDLIILGRPFVHDPAQARGVGVAIHLANSVALAQVCAVPQNNGANVSTAANQTVNGYFTPANGTYSAGAQPTITRFQRSRRAVRCDNETGSTMLAPSPPDQPTIEPDGTVMHARPASSP